MFGFRLWAPFGAFRDPLTITQNMTLSIPPKTTIGGMLAAILGLDYRNYFNDPAFFDFGYSLVLQKPVRKRSFSQNYIEDYTKKSALRLDAMLKTRDSQQTLANLEEQKSLLEQKCCTTETDRKKIASLGKKIAATEMNLRKAVEGWSRKSAEKLTKPKPIFRELLIDPTFFIFINDFKYETEIVALMRNHESAYPLYMGNSEFAANYRYEACASWEPKELIELDSFTGSPEKIDFESGKKYTNIYAATRTTDDRSYREFKQVVVCDGKISLRSPIRGFEVTTANGRLGCDFI